MVEVHYQKIEEIIDQQIAAGVKKATTKLPRFIILGVMAGMFISLGAQACSLVMHSISNVGLDRLAGASVFPVGLMLIIFLGGELFTSDCLITISALSGKISWARFARSLILVYLSNFIGALLIAWMINHSGQLDYSHGGLGAYTIKVAIGKVNMALGQAFISGILCNILVCLAVFMGMSATDIAGKCLAIFFPIFAFVVSGFEHCVANMYYIPAGIFAAANPEYIHSAGELFEITTEQLQVLTWSNMFHNLLPVTAGNMIGGIVCIGFTYWFLYKKSQ